MAPTTSLRRLAALAGAASLLLAGCGDDDTSALDASSPTTERVDPLDSDEVTDPTDTDATAPTSTTSTTEAPEDAGAAAGVDADRVIEIGYSGGQVDGGGRQPVSVGDTVALVITSDVADEVHVHGYDLYADLVPGEAAVVEFTADIPGVFEVELHDARVPLVELEVS
ncbi:MAG: hypothetical protein ACLGIC_03060 [Acidimicrobiia bacterium]